MLAITALVILFTVLLSACNDGHGVSDSGSTADGGGMADTDSPIPTDPCGKKLSVHNGTVHPDFGVVPDGGVFIGDPVEEGPFKTIAADSTLTNPDPTRGPVNVTVYSPSKDGLTPIPGPFGMIVLLPGFTSTHKDYLSFTTHFVSHGFAVLGVTPAWFDMEHDANNPASVAEIRSAIDWALQNDPLSGRVDLDKIVAAGHSAGGKLAFFTAAMDARIKIVIGWDPQNGGGPPCFVDATTCERWPVAPVCDPDRGVEDPGIMYKINAETMIFAARDEIITPDKQLWAENFYRGAPSPAHIVIFKTARHTDWPAGAPADATKRVQLSLLMARLMGVRGLESYLPGGGYIAGLPDVTQYNK